MIDQFTLEYWRDGEFFVGRLVEVPIIFSQGKTLKELKENIQDAWEVMFRKGSSPVPPQQD